MIRLRKLEPADLPLLYRWENDSAQWRDGQTHNPLSQADLRRYIEQTTGDIYKDGQLTLIIEDSPDSSSNLSYGAAIGLIELGELDILNGRAEVGIYIAPDERGKGAGTMALQALIDYTFQFLRFRLLVAKVRATNLHAVHLFQSCGFVYVATLPKWLKDDDVKVYIAEPNLNSL